MTRLFFSIKRPLSRLLEELKEIIHELVVEENFWSLLKRTLRGTYVSVEPFHVHRYVDEQNYRFNNRDGNNIERLVKIISGVAGKRMTYKRLTGKENQPRLLPT